MKQGHYSVTRHVPKYLIAGRAEALNEAAAAHVNVFAEVQAAYPLVHSHFKHVLIPLRIYKHKHYRILKLCYRTPKDCFDSTNTAGF